MKQRSRAWNTALDILALVAGSALYAGAVNLFTVPNNIAPGGVTGIATIFNHLFGLPIGTMILIINIPLFLIGAKVMGFRFLGKTAVATVLVSVFIDVSAPFIDRFAYTSDSLLASVYGGVLSGAGLAIIFLRGGTTGGTDILARVIHRYKPHFSMGRLILILDAIIITGAGIAYRSVDSALYAVIVIFASSVVIDRVLFGADAGKAVYVMSKKSEEITKAIMERMGRGVTLLDGHGAYTGQKKTIILCVVRKHETTRLRRLVDEIDPDAFMLISGAGEVLGEGFKSLEDD